MSEPIVLQSKKYVSALPGGIGLLVTGPVDEFVDRLFSRYSELEAIRMDCMMTGRVMDPALFAEKKEIEEFLAVAYGGPYE
jgi:hypothetical protein